MQVAIPACRLEAPDEMSTMLYESHLAFKQQSAKSGLSSALEAFEALVTKPDNAEERKAIEANLDSMQEFFSSLQAAETALEAAVGSSEEPETEDDMEKREEMVSKASLIKRRMAAGIRME